MLALFGFTLNALSAETKTIVCMGDSLTAGYGLANPDAEAYPALLQQKSKLTACPTALSAPGSVVTRPREDYVALIGCSDNESTFWYSPSAATTVCAGSPLRSPRQI